MIKNILLLFFILTTIAFGVMLMKEQTKNEQLEYHLACIHSELSKAKRDIKKWKQRAEEYYEQIQEQKNND